MKCKREHSTSGKIRLSNLISSACNKLPSIYDIHYINIIYIIQRSTNGTDKEFKNIGTELMCKLKNLEKRNGITETQEMRVK